MADSSMTIKPMPVQRKPMASQVIVARKAIGRVLAITADRIARDWDRGVSARSLARMYELRAWEVDEILRAKRAWREQPTGPASVVSIRRAA